MDNYRKYIKYKNKYLNIINAGSKPTPNVFSDDFWTQEDKTITKQSSSAVSPVVSPVVSPIDSLKVLEAPKFEFEIMDENIKTIYALSDIHGDILSFIINLRDCAKVIKKKIHIDSNQTRNAFSDTFDYTLDDNIRDNNGIRISSCGYLNMPLYIDGRDNPAYTDDLDYEWCGETAHIVITGDIIDNWRYGNNTEPNNGGRRFGEYPFEEIKIIRFINAINKSAMKHGGRIIKLIGNHELANISYEHTLENFISPYAKNNTINGINRVNYFTPGFKGAELLVEDGIGVVVKIFDFIFLHAGITDNYKTGVENITNHLDSLNIKLNKYLIGEIPEFIINGQDENDLLWTRELGAGTTHSMWNTALKAELENNDTTQMQKYCNYINNQLGRFGNKEHKLRLVVGHCNQNFLLFPENDDPRRDKNYNYPEIKYKTSTYTDLVDQDIYLASETLGIPVLRSSQIEKNEHYEVGNLWGITMDCSINQPYFNKDGDNEPSIYRIDNSSSRAFQFPGILNHLKETSIENKGKVLRRYIYSNTPQLLKISIEPEGKYTVEIIRSTLRNTIIHMLPDKRYFDDELIKAILENKIEEIIPY
jgi:hypothetical protein